MDMVMETAPLPLPSRWLNHTARTDPAAWEAEIKGLPSDVAALNRVVQGLLVHSEWLTAYGLDPSLADAASRTTLPVSKRLASLTADAPRLDIARPPARRELGTCRDFALLLCSFLRVKNIPARLRCGFASYLSADWEDHWICEYWSTENSTWILTDPQLDDIMRADCNVTFNTSDMPRDVFLTAGQAWRQCRTGLSSPEAFGHGDTKGLWFIGVNVVRDGLTLRGEETSLWDRWREAALEWRSVPLDHLPEFDRLAERPEQEFIERTPPWLQAPLQEKMTYRPSARGNTHG